MSFVALSIVKAQLWRLYLRRYSRHYVLGLTTSTNESNPANFCKRLHMAALA
jgi:hypothetical protein